MLFRCDKRPSGEYKRSYYQEMILNTILRCDKYGLRQINAILFARVPTHLSAKEFATSLVGKSQFWNVIKHRQGSNLIGELIQRIKQPQAMVPFDLIVDIT